MKLTKNQQKLHSQSIQEGPVWCYGGGTRTAYSLDRKGIGHTTSTPPNGQPYNLSPYGTYYVANNWAFNQVTKLWELVNNKN